MSQARVRAVLAPRLPGGDRAAVLVVGAGLNRAAAALSDDASAALAHDWSSLLLTLAHDVGLEALPASFLMAWESLVRAHARHDGVKAHRAEDALRRTLARHVERARDDAPDELHRALLDRGFRDIVTLNFGLGLERASDGAHFVRTRTPDRHARALVDHAWVARAGGLTRVWHAHGHLRDPTTVKMGVDAYAKHIARLGHVFAAHKARERVAARADHDVVRRDAKTNDLAWPELFFVAPLVFAGCGLALDEWELWWLLHQRARNALRRGDRAPATLVLVAGEIPRHLEGAPADVEVVRFASHDALWGALLDDDDASTR